LRAGKPALCGTWIEGTCSELEVCTRKGAPAGISCCLVTMPVFTRCW
jgi:hypothetical protein